MTDLRLFLFGPPRLEQDGQGVEISLRKAQALLAYLAVNRQAYNRDALATLFWPESDASRARANLRRTLFELNQVLGDAALETVGDSLQIHPDQALWLDTERFDELAEGCLPGPSKFSELNPACLERLEHAAELYSDDFLEGFSLPDSPAFDEWQFFEAERLRQTLVRVLEALVEANQMRGQYGPAIDYARRRLSLDPLHEPAHRRLMELYAGSGQTAAAMRQYEICVQTLQEELDLEPEPETVALLEAIRSGDATRSKPVEAVPPGRPTVHLPVQATPFVGRREELKAIQELLNGEGARLLTLIGPGGSGKTRLAIQAAASVLEMTPDRYPDGAFFVYLAPLESVSSLTPAIAEALDFSFYKETKNQRQQLIDYLQPRRLLLVLDNYEHLLDGDGVGLPVEILKSAPGVNLLVTSRTRLNVQGEQLFPVAGMQIPPTELEEWQLLSSELAEAYSAVSLFLQSAQRARPGFVLSDENLGHVVHVCRLVQGMPLAIELAASWIELLSPAEIAAEIERSLDFLETEWRDVPERQRSLRAVFEASWDMLTGAEREAFKKMAVFRGGFSRPAAQQVAGASLRTLLGLANKSWLHRLDESRFAIHELLRQYALEKLAANPGEWQASRDRHSQYYCDFLAERGEEMKGPRQTTAIETVAAEFENIRAAWNFAVEASAWERIWRMLFGLVRYCFVRIQIEELFQLLASLQNAVGERERDPESPLLNAAVVAIRSHIHSMLEGGPHGEDRENLKANWEHAAALQKEQKPDFIYLLLIGEYAWSVDEEEGMQRLEELIPVLRRKGEAWLLARACLSLGELHQRRRENERSRKLLSEALAILRGLEDHIEIASSLRSLGMVSAIERDYDQAEAYFLDALQMSEQSDDRPGMGYTSMDLGNLYVEVGKFDQAIETFRKIHLLSAETGNRRMEAYSLGEKSMLDVRYGDLDDAREARQQSLEVSFAIQDVTGMSWGNWEMGEIYRVAGDFQAAQKHFDQALEIFRQYGIDMGIAFVHRGRGDIALSKGDYSEAYRNFETYRAISDQEHFQWSVAYALNGLGRAALGLGHVQEAEKHLIASLEQAWTMGNRGLAMAPLTSLAELLLAAGQAEAALELADFVLAQYMTWNETQRQAEDIRLQAAEQLPEEKAAAERRGREMELETQVTRWIKTES